MRMSFLDGSCSFNLDNLDLIIYTVYNYSMRTKIQYRWRILWAGHWVTTGHHCTEEQIRKEHPEAVRIDHSRRELEVAETSDERRNFMFPM